MCTRYSCNCAFTELNLQRTDAGTAFEGCAAGLSAAHAAILGQLTRLDLSQGLAPMAAADAAAVIRSCTALRWLGAPEVRESGAHRPMKHTAAWYLL